MPLCPNCGSQQPDEAAFCDECGARLGADSGSAPSPPPSAQPGGAQQGTMTCPECGASVMPGEAFCDNCGAALDAPAPAHQQGMSSAAQSSPPPSPARVQQSPLICPNCGAQLEPGSNFCDMCGEPIEEAPPSGTRTEPPMQPPQQPQQPHAHPSRQPDYSVPGAVHGRFVVQDTGATLPFPSGRTEFTVGREDPVSGIFPEIDLTDYGGDEGGVSRQHARVTIQDSEVFIEDLNSVNFTCVNRQKLTPRQPHRLNDGDEVQLGRVRLTFQG